MAFIPKSVSCEKVSKCARPAWHIRALPRAIAMNSCLMTFLRVNNAKRDHFDFVTKMRERDVEVVEMPILLAETMETGRQEAGS